MVLECIFPVKKVIKHPLDMFIFSMIITFASIYVSSLIFPGVSAGKVIILFITISVSPTLFLLFLKEEESERKVAENQLHQSFFERYEDIVELLSLFFLGVFAAIFIFSILSPETAVKNTFDDQLMEIERVSSLSGSFTTNEALELIVKNNLRVMGLSFFLSFLLGVGAVVILGWNASILALYLASFLRKGLVSEFLARTISLIPHAPIEILSYFVAGVAGGILSAGLMRERIISREFSLILRDSLILMSLAVFFVLMGALFEVFI